MGIPSDVLNKALLQVKEHGEILKRKHENAVKSAYKAELRLSAIDAEVLAASGAMGSAALSGDKSKIAEITEKLTALSNEKAGILTKLGVSGHPKCNCSKCNDTGYTNGKLCDCVITTAKEIMSKSLSGEMPLETSTFDKFSLNYYSKNADNNGHSPYETVKTTFDIAKNFADTFPNAANLLFCGAPGLGKTHLSLAIANEVIAKGYGVIYASAQNLINSIKNEQFSNNGESDVLDSVLNTDLLILDDLGTEFSTAFTASIIYNIINTRLLKNLSTVISTNLTLSEIEKVYSSRVLSRIIGGYKMRQFIGDDIRQIKVLS